MHERQTYAAVKHFVDNQISRNVNQEDEQFNTDSR
jgi:hypothetical protein